ncbi:hydroxymethylglutaryl-CoA reductase, degradative [Sulfitobacter sp. MOLA879]|uniref:hydroxymethylglutaryl-CoA reductase, degradative n=1 Tax=Sulfitobacter sp. MOLA879 TaxID=3368579 RepID=UPI0037461FAE
MVDGTTVQINSRLENLRNLEPEARLDLLAKTVDLTATDQTALAGRDVLPMSTANGMIENVIGKFELPLGVASNFTINDKDYLIPMAVEEPSVVAAASYMAKIARGCGGFHASSDRPVMRAQIQVVGLTDPTGARHRLLAAETELREMCNARDEVLVSLGGGCIGIEVHVFESTAVGPMAVIHILVDVRDAMGANAVNSMAETIAPRVAEITGGHTRLRILSNLADRRLARAHVTLTPEAMTTKAMDGHEVITGMIEAYALAQIDPYRAATHNKGIMNGIDPVVVATGNDWRAIEAGAHAWAAHKGSYTSLTTWERGKDGSLTGTIEMPMALGLVGGATKTHPAAQAALRILNVETAQELAEVTVAVGLAQNMAALRALATEGIQKGHMALHARNIAILAGATGPQIEAVAKVIAGEGHVSVQAAKKVLSEL